MNEHDSARANMAGDTILPASPGGRPVALRLKSRNIPQRLKHFPQWVTWRYERRDDRWAKIPYNPTTGRPASTNDPTTWVAYVEAICAYAGKKCDGIGFVFSHNDEFAGVDLDKCVDPETGLPNAEASALIVALDTYTEISPSGTGLKFFLEGTVPGPKRKAGPREMYDSVRFFTMTGHRIPTAPTTVEARQEPLAAVYRDIFGESVSPARTVRSPATTAARIAAPRPSFPLHPADREIIRRAGRAKNGEKFRRLMAGDWRGLFPNQCGQNEADLALCEFLFFWGASTEQTDRIMRWSALYREKWERDDYRTATLEKARQRAEVSRQTWRAQKG